MVGSFGEIDWEGFMDCRNMVGISTRLRAAFSLGALLLMGTGCDAGSVEGVAGEGATALVSTALVSTALVSTALVSTALVSTATVARPGVPSSDGGLEAGRAGAPGAGTLDAALKLRSAISALEANGGTWPQSSLETDLTSTWSSEGAGAASDASSSEVPDGAMMVVDLGSTRLTVLRMSDAARLWDYSLLRYQKAICTPTSICVLYETKHSVRQDRDYITYVMTAFTDNFQSSLHQVAMDDPANPVFSLRGLDYSGVPSSNCTAPVEQTCDPEAAARLDFQCAMRFSHSFHVVAQDPEAKWVKIIITDTLNGRIQQVHLDYSNGNQCGKIEWMLDGSNESFDDGCGPNDVQVFEQGDDDYMMVSCHSVTEIFGEGQVHMFKGRNVGPGTTWNRIWTYPDPAAIDEQVFVNTPHHPRLFPLEGGGYDMYYAHSASLGAFWGMGNEGTIGSARLASLETPPDYIADEGLDVMTEDPTFGFLRSIERLPGGQRMVSDSMGYGPIPGVESVMYLLGPNTGSNSTLEGNWTREHNNLNLTEVGDNVIRSYTCNWMLVWGAYYLEPAAFGSFLRDREVTADRFCEILEP